MQFTIRRDDSGRCIWTETDDGLVYDASVYENDLALINQTQLAECLAKANDANLMESFEDAQFLARRISSILMPILEGAPKLSGAPMFDVPAPISTTLKSPNRISVADWVRRFPSVTD